MKTLAEVLGQTAHLSPLLRKFRKYGFLNLSQIKQLAVQRGCKHYQDNTPPVSDPGLDTLSNEELVVSLLLGEQEYDPVAIRIAGQLITSVQDLFLLRRLALRERVEDRLIYIAEKGKEIEPEDPFWDIVTDGRSSSTFPVGAMPHTDRFTTDLPRASISSPRKRKWLRVAGNLT